MIRAFSTVLLIFIFSLSFAQTWQWAKYAGGTNLDYGNAIIVDAIGNSYITGYFYGSATFQSTNITSNGYGDVFLAKYNSNGNLVWIKTAGSAGGNDYGYGIALDQIGNLCITGRFETSAIFGSYTLTASGNSDIFIAKYDTSGNTIWAKSAGALGNDAGNSISVDSVGNSFIAGYFNYGNSSNPLIIGNDTMYSSVGESFIAKYNPFGNPVWAKRSVEVGSVSWQDAKISTDNSSNVYTTCMFSDTIVIGADTLISMTAIPFIAKYDSSGNPLWAKKIPFTGGPYLYDLKADSIGNIYTTGEYIGTGILGTDTITNSTSNGSFYIAKYNTNGIAQWGQTAIGNDGSIGEGISVDSYGNSYISGTFLDTVTIGSNTMISAGNRDIFVAKYSTIGSFLWTKQAGGLNYDVGNSIGNDANGNSYLIGTFYGGLPSFGSTMLNGYGSSDIFIAKLNDILTQTEISYNSNSGFIIYPNPFTAFTTIEFSNRLNLSFDFIIYNKLGQEVKRISQISQTSIIVERGNLTNGIYFFSIQTKEGSTLSKGKLIIQ